MENVSLLGNIWILETNGVAYGVGCVKKTFRVQRHQRNASRTNNLENMQQWMG